MLTQRLSPRMVRHHLRSYGLTRRNIWKQTVTLQPLQFGTHYPLASVVLPLQTYLLTYKQSELTLPCVFM